VSVGVFNSQFQLNPPGIVTSYGLSGSNDFNHIATAFSLYGAMQLDEYLSLEADLLIAGDITTREPGQVAKLFDVGSFAVAVVLVKPVGERSRIFVCLGSHFWDISESSGEFSYDQKSGRFNLWYRQRYHNGEFTDFVWWRIN